MNHKPTTLTALLSAFVMTLACGGSPAAPTGARLEITQLATTLSGTSGDYTYTIEMRVTNHSGEPATIDEFRIEILAAGQSIGNFAETPAPSQRTLAPGAQLLVSPVTKSAAKERGDTMTMTVAYDDAGGSHEISQSITLPK